MDKGLTRQGLFAIILRKSCNIFVINVTEMHKIITELKHLKARALEHLHFALAGAERYPRISRTPSDVMQLKVKDSFEPILTSE